MTGRTETRAAARSGVRVAASLVAIALGGCFDTDECTQLRQLRDEARRALRVVQGRSQIAGRTAESLARLKSEVQEKLDAAGLELSGDELEAQLEERASAVRGAKLERTTRPAAPAPGSAPDPEAATETVFRFQFPASDLSEAWSKAQTLIAEPPLTRLLSLLAPKGRGQPWVLDVGQVDVQRVPMKVEPKDIPPRPSPDEVPSSFGFCGAGELRREIAEIEAEIDGFRDAAKQTTVNLPLIASWKGLSRRVDLSVQTEAESRRIAADLVQAVLASRQRFIGLAAEKEAVLLEVKGGKAELAKLQAEVPKVRLEALQELPPAREGVARMAVGNRVAAAGRRPEPGGGPHGPGGGPPRGPPTPRP